MGPELSRLIVSSGNTPHPVLKAAELLAIHSPDSMSIPAQMVQTGLSSAAVYPGFWDFRQMRLDGVD